MFSTRTSPLPTPDIIFGLSTRLTNNTKTPLENQSSPLRGVKTVQEDPIETYRLLTCSICTTHDCCFHELDRCEIFPQVIDDSTPFVENEPCSEECYLRQVLPIVSMCIDNSLVWNIHPSTPAIGPMKKYHFSRHVYESKGATIELHVSPLSVLPNPASRSTPK
jgi:hypothetical protein